MTAKLLAIVLIAGFHFSGCTGNLGLLSLALTGEALSGDTVPMSRFVLSCTQQDSIEQKAKSSSGCTDGKSCLQRLHLTSTERLTIFMVVGFLFLVTTYQLLGFKFSAPIQLRLARDGPLYEDAPLFAKAIVKRE